jgi:hypothetical protein
MNDATRMIVADGRVISLAEVRRRLEDADPGQWMLDQLGREIAMGIRQQAGLVAEVLQFRGSGRPA